jgi:beta-glucosidase
MKFWRLRARGARRIATGAAALSALALTVPGLAPASAQAAGTGPARLAAAASPSCPWLSTSLPVYRRVDLLMHAMTLADEINLVHGATGPYVFYVAPEPSLCIPGIGLEDGPNGVADGLTGVTQLPAGVSLAAGFDPALAHSYGQVLGAEEAGKGAMVDLGPTVNIVRDPRFGRAFETFTEDPYLNSQLAVAEIRGIQGQGVMAQVKHIAVYNQETNRNTSADNVQIGQQALHEIYLPAFKASVQQAQVASTMCSYSMINNAFACGNVPLLASTLKQAWGFRGFVTSDYDAMHGMTSSLQAGTDMEQPDAIYYGATLEQAVQNGTVSQATLNTMVQRILTQLFRFGFFSHPPAGNTGAAVTTPAHVAVANRVAEAGTVLLQNKNAVLPLRKGGTVAVIGADAADAVTAGGGSAHVISPSSAVSPLAGLRAADPTATVTYSPGTDPVNPGTDLPGLPAVPSSVLHPSVGSSTPGLTGTYYNNQNFTGTPQLTRTDPGISLDYSWYGLGYEDATSAPPAPPNPYSTSVKWTGVITPPVSGTYTFDLTSDNSSKMYLNGQLFIDNSSAQGLVTKSATVKLTGGQSVPVEVDYASGYPMQIKLGWQPPPGAVPPAILAAASLARRSQQAVVFVRDYETEGVDRPDITLPNFQDQLIEAVAAANPHTVVVLETGAPVAMPWASQVSGILEAWYPGQTQGTAIADVLSGKTDPGGHLPETFPASLSQVPAAAPAQWPGTNGTVQYSEGVDVGYRWYDAKGITPLFPFGYGLSYTTFRYSGLHVSAPSSATSPVTVTATVTNTGHRGGSDVAQLYLGDPAAAGEPPRQLAGFQRVQLAPGKSAQVRFTIQPAQTWYWDTSAGGWSQQPGTYQVYVGDSSGLGGLPLRGGFRLPAAAGARAVSVHAPAQAAAGGTFQVTVTLSAGGTATLHGVQLYLQPPLGWKVSSAGSGRPKSLAPGTAASQTFRVTVPPGTPAADAILHAVADLGSCSGGPSSPGCLGVQREAGTAITVTG